MRVVIIANPAARAISDELVTEVAAASILRSGADGVAVHRTAAPGHATTLAQSTSDPDTVILAVGGDGTAREVVDGLAGS